MAANFIYWAPFVLGDIGRGGRGVLWVRKGEAEGGVEWEGGGSLAGYILALYIFIINS